jgi:hypothetical protein
MNGSAAQLDSSSSSSKGVLTQPWAAAKVHRKFPLLQPTLTGLGRYSHLISVDYFNDLMAVLQEVRGADGACNRMVNVGLLLCVVLPVWFVLQKVRRVTCLACG